MVSVLLSVTSHQVKVAQHPTYAPIVYEISFYLNELCACCYRISFVGASTGPKPPFFTATALEVMLRVTAQELHRAYGESFLSLLRVVQDAILPNIAADAPRREELKTFLNVFLSSRGANFMSLFNKPVNAAV